MTDCILYALYTLLILFLGRRLGAKAPECSHQFHIYHKERYRSEGEIQTQTFGRYHLRCTKCGDMTKRDMK